MHVYFCVSEGNSTSLCVCEGKIEFVPLYVCVRRESRAVSDHPWLMYPSAGKFSYKNRLQKTVKKKR